MIDHKKRSTLKILTVTTGALSVAGTSLAAVLSAEKNTLNNANAAGIQASTRLSVQRNDIEVVLTNATNQAITLTEIVPGSIRVARGEFNFSQLFEEGPVVIDAGKSVSVPLQRKPVIINIGAQSSSGSLHEVFKQSLSILTDGGLSAPVTVANTAAMA